MRTQKGAITFLLTLFLAFLFAISCGGDGDVEQAAKKVAEALDPWAGVGNAALPEEDGVVTESVRVLSFDDGMTISYDGSDTDTGQEEVCRRQTAEGTHYEACMPLEDDPLLIAPENFALVWRPLLFERFATELTCRSWMEGDAEKNEVDCETVMLAFGSGEEDFSCAAGVVNGDKALKCSDKWAVVVNGDEDGTKTVCRVHTGNGRGRCLGAPTVRKVVDENGMEIEEEVPDEELILEMQRTAWEGYLSGQDNNRQFAQGETVAPTVPQGLPAGAELSWRSRDEEICTVDTDDSDGGVGTVMIAEVLTPPIDCKIVLKIVAEGFADRVFVTRLAVLKNNDTDWADYTLDNDLLYPGETLAARAVTHTEPASPDVTFKSLDETICTVDAADGTITAVLDGICDVHLTSKADDYLDVVVKKSLMVSRLGTYGDILWSAFPATAQVGVDTAALADAVVNDGDGSAITDTSLVVTVAYESGDCAWDAQNKTLSFTDTTECVISVSASGVRGLGEKTQEFRVTPDIGSLTLTWTGYADIGSGANVAVYGGSAPAPDAPNADVDGAEFAYSATGGGCEVDPANGALTLASATGDGVTCEVTLTAKVQGYNEGTQTVAVTISKADQSLSPPSNAYGSVASVQNSGTLELINAPTGGFGTLEYQASSGDCTVDSANGGITASASGTTACEVQAKWGGDDNHNPSDFATIATIAVVASANDAVPTWSAAPYASNPTVGGAAVNIAADAISNTGAGTGAVEYSSGTPEYCSVDLANGDLSGTGAGSCIVRARFVGDSSKGASDWADSPSITIDQGGHPALAADPYGSGATVAVNETLSFETVPVGYGVENYGVKEVPPHCSVDDEGIITGISAGTCTVQVEFAGNNDYGALALTDLQAVTVTPGIQGITLAELGTYGEGPTVMVGGQLMVVEDPIASQGGAIGYQVKDGSQSYCTVGADGTVEGSAKGECIVQARAEATADGNYGVGEWMDAAVIAVEAGVLNTLAWSPGYSRSFVGVPRIFPAVDVGNAGGVTVSYVVKDAGDTDCAFEEADIDDPTAERTLNIEGRGRCVVAARGEKAEYETWEQEFAIDADLSHLTLSDGAWGTFWGQTLAVGEGVITPRMSTGQGQGSQGSTPMGSFRAIDYSDSDAQGMCPVDANTWGDCPEVTGPVSLDGVVMRYSLLRGEKDCRLTNYRTGEVEALPVPIQRVQHNATKTFTRAIQVDVLRFRAVSGGVAGNSISVEIGSGTNSDKKYVITDGTTTETYDDLALKDVLTTMGSSALVEVDVITHVGEPSNKSATDLAGGVDGVKSTVTLTSSSGNGSVTFNAKSAGVGGDLLTVTVEAGTNSDKKYTINDNDTGAEEIYDDIAIANLATALAASSLVDVVVNDASSELDDAANTSLAGGVDEEMAAMVFARPGEEAVLEFTALSGGEGGNNITVTIEDGTNSDKKYTIVDSGGAPEVYDDVAIGDLESVIANSLLVGVNIFDTDNEPDNAAVTALVGGGGSITTKCSLTATAMKKGYRLARSRPIEVALSPGQIQLAGLPRYQGMRTNPDNTVQLPIGGTLPIEQHPQTGVGRTLQLSYSGQGYTAGTTDFTDSSNYKAAVCTVDVDPASADFGTIVAGAAGDSVGKGDICRVTFALHDPLGTWEDLRFSFNFIVAVDNLDFTTVPTLSYGNGAKLKIGVSTPLDPTALPRRDNADPPVNVVWKHEVEGLASDGTSGKEGVCRVDGRVQVEDPSRPITDGGTPTGQFEMMDNPHYGRVTLGEDAANGDTCRIKAYATAPGYNWYEGVAAVDFVVDGLDLLFTQEGTKPVYPNELRVSGVAAPDTVTTLDDNGIDVTWMEWRVVGTDVDNGGTADNANVCAIDPASGVVSLGSAASATDTCAVYAKAAATTAENYDIEEILLAEFTIEAQGTFTSVDGPVYDGDGLTVGRTEPLSFSRGPISVPEVLGSTWEYAATGKRAGVETADICGIDTEGTITLGSDAQKGDNCEIVATVIGNGYANAADQSPYVLTVKEVFDSVAWADFPTSVTAGDQVDLSGTLPVATPTDDGEGNDAEITIAVLSGDCAWNEDTNVLSFSDITLCEVSVTATLPDYANKVEVFSVTPEAGTILVGSAGDDDATKWGTYNTVTVGLGAVSAPAIAATVPPTVGKAYTTSTDTICSVNGDDGTVTGLDDDNCEITLTLSKSGFASISHTYTIAVQTGTQGTIVWGNFGSDTLQVGGVARTPSAATGVGVAGATIGYTIKSGSEANCTLEDGPTGRVAAREVSLTPSKSCIIIGTATRKGYADVTSGDIAISLSPGVLDTITWGSFSGTLEVGGATQTPGAVSGAGVTGSRIRYGLGSGSATNCTLESDTTGEVRAKAVDISGGTVSCAVVGTATRTGYTTKTSAPISIDLSPGTQDTITWGSFDGRLKVGAASAKAPSAVTGAGVAAATIRYGLKSGSATNCTLENDTTGAVKAKAVDLTGGTVNCIVIGSATRTGYTTKTSGDISIRLSAGTQSGITWASFPNDSTLEIGGASRTPTGLSGLGAGAVVTYALSTAANCTLDDDATGEVSAKAVDLSGSPVCTIVATSVRTGYSNISSGNISIPLSIGTMGNLTAPGYGGGTLAVGEAWPS